MKTSEINDSFALDYVNYTSTKFNVQFQYPTDWIQTEKITGRETGADISVFENSNRSGSSFWITRGNNTEIGSDLQMGVERIFKMLNESYGSNNYEIMVPASFVTIDGQITVTFIYSSRNKITETVYQIWLTYIGSKADYYLLSFVAPLSSFNNPNIGEARAQFIKTMKFLDRK
jgi:hypothetical protein